MHILKTSILYFFALIALWIGPRPALAQDKPWMFGPFERPEGKNPIISPTDSASFQCPVRGIRVQWEARDTFNPAPVVRKDTLYVLYRAEDRTGERESGTSRIGLAASTDGIHFVRRPTPVLYPDEDDQKMNEWPGGCEDPRVVETEGGRYVMTYTQWNLNKPKLAVATSRDLIHWRKHGPAFARALDGKYSGLPGKAGAIVAREESGRMIATKIGGLYWMYWGVPKIYLATSHDLINWEPLEDQQGQLQTVMTPRSGFFDSWLVEPGPPAVLTEEGIVLIYNAGNRSDDGDPSLGHRMYTGGQALFDRSNPSVLIDRTDRPFVKPVLPFEFEGWYQGGIAFLEGVARYDGRWFLYYGGADSHVGVMVSE